MEESGNTLRNEFKRRRVCVDFTWNSFIKFVNILIYSRGEIEKSGTFNIDALKLALVVVFANLALELKRLTFNCSVLGAGTRSWFIAIRYFDQSCVSNVQIVVILIHFNIHGVAHNISFIITLKKISSIKYVSVEV